MSVPCQEVMAELPLSPGYSEGSCELNIQVESFCGLTQKGKIINITILGPITGVLRLKAERGRVEWKMHQSSQVELDQKVWLVLGLSGHGQTLSVIYPEKRVLRIHLG